MKTALVFSLSLVLLTACATKTSTADGTIVPDSWIEIREDAATQRYLVALTNPEDHPICVASKSFPTLGAIDSAGRLDWGDPYVEAHGKQYVAAFRDTGWCGDICSARIRPGVTYQGAILFSQFPGVDFSEPDTSRRLHLIVRTTTCRGVWFEAKSRELF